MTWRMAKRAIDNGCRVKRAIWSGSIERHNSEDKTIYCVVLGNSTDDPYHYIDADLKKARDFEIVSQ